MLSGRSKDITRNIS